MNRSNVAFKKRHNRFHHRNALTTMQQKQLLKKNKEAKQEAHPKKEKATKEISNVSDISNWIRKNRKEDHFIPEKESRPYRKFEKSTQELIRWQALYLISNGLSFSRTSQILSIHRTTASLWWRQHLNSDSNESSTTMLNKTFEHLTPEMKSVLIKQLFVFKEEERIQKTIAGMLTLINDDLAAKWLQTYQDDSSIDETKPTSFANYSVALTPSENIEANLFDSNNISHIDSVNNSSDRLIPAYFETKSFEGKSPLDDELEQISNRDSSFEQERNFKPSSPLKTKLKRLIGLSVERVADQDNVEIAEKDTKQQSVSLSEQDLPPFYLADPEAFIQLSSNTKIIKEKDYALYCESSDLLQASKDFLKESKQRAIQIEEEAIDSANIKAEKIIEAAKKEGKREADNLIAEKNIEATKASIEHIASLEASLPDLIMSIVRKIIVDYDDQEFVIKNIKSAVSNLSDCEEIKIHVSTNVINSVNTHLSTATYAGKITLIPDSSLNDKDCLIVTKLGVINACLETQLQKIESEMTSTSQENSHHVTVAF